MVTQNTTRNDDTHKRCEPHDTQRAQRLLCSALCSVVCVGWVGSCYPNVGDTVDSKCHIGLRVMTYDSTGDGSNVQTLTLPNGCKDAPGGLDQPPAGYCGRWFDGGTIILATGIISYVVFLLSVVLLVIAHRRIISNYRQSSAHGAV